MSGLPTYYAIHIHRKCPDPAVQFIVDQLQLDWDAGGGGLVVQLQQPSHLLPDPVLHVSASNSHILRIADAIEIKKEDKDGFIRAVTLEDISDFPESGRVGPLAISDVHRCILHAIHRIHFDKETTTLPGSGGSVTKGSPVVSSYEEHRYVTVVAVHDEEALDKLYKSWKRTILHAPVDSVRDYFGEGVALFFSFSQTYTSFLFIIALLGVIEHTIEQYLGFNYVYSNVIFTLLNIVGLSLYLEVWKRKSNEHAFAWGSGGKLRHKPPRPEYRGELRLSPVSGREELYYPPGKTIKKILLVSLPLTLLCLSLAFGLMLASFWAEAAMTAGLTDPETGELYSDPVSTILSNVPSVSYSLVIIIFNSIYLKLARRLTIWENHRTQEQHDTHVTLKLIMFEFTNTFLALFYVGFYQQDLKALRAQLFTTLMVQQVVNQVQEVLLPFFLHRPASQRIINRLGTRLGIKDNSEPRNVERVSVMAGEDARVESVTRDLAAEPLESLHDDFMEMWLQFGHVFLFSAVYPLAALIALANNLTELWADRYKLCRLSRKPRPLCVRDIGAWYTAFRLTGMIAIVTNCSLLALELSEAGGGEEAEAASALSASWCLGWVGVEHVLLLLFLGVGRLVNDVPAHVKLAMDRTDFHFRTKAVKVKED